MKKAILGKKVGMTQMFLSDGTMIPVTVIEAGPCPVVQKKTVATDGYDAIQVGFSEIREKLANKPLIGHCAKANVKVMRYLREFKLEDAASYEVGQVIKADVFATGDRVDVSGKSKGKGFQGTIKRWNQARGRKTPRLPLLPRCRFHGRLHLPGRGLQDQAPAGSHGQRERDGAEPRGCARRRRAEPPVGQGRHPRRQGQHGRRQEHREVRKEETQMPQVAVYDISGKTVGQIELSENTFGQPVNAAVLHEVVKAYLANQRQGTQSALTRAEVRGGGIKPWRQKGTGRARQGSTRAPQWRHGGVVFAPKPRDYTIRVNRKVKRLAMKSALSSKVLDQDLIVFDALNLEAPKTKEMVKVLNAVDVKKALIVLAAPDETVERAARNIPGVKTTLVGTLNVYEILKYQKLILTKESAQKIEEVYV